MENGDVPAIIIDGSESLYKKLAEEGSTWIEPLAGYHRGSPVNGAND